MTTRTAPTKRKVKKLPYMLEDGVQRNKQHPDTFYIPSQEERTSLQVGDVAKLVFLYRESDVICGGERMWVLITKVQDDGYEGTLDNKPFMADVLHFGEVVRFKPEHVIDCQTKAEMAAVQQAIAAKN